MTGAANHPDVIIHSAECQSKTVQLLGQVVYLLSELVGSEVKPIATPKLGLDFMEDLLNDIPTDSPEAQAEIELARLESRDADSHRFPP